MSDAPALFFAPRTCARVALTALEELGIPFETRLVAFLAGEHRHPGYRAMHPGGKVPALRTSDGVVVQSGAILSYLADRYPEGGLLPRRETEIGRAAVLSELFRCSSDLHPLVTRFVMAPMISIDAGDAPRIREKAAELLATQLAPLAERFGRQDWCLEEGWSVLDAYIAWIWFRITDSGFDQCAFAPIAEQFERASARPSAQAALAREARAEEELLARGLLFRPAYSSGNRASAPLT